MKRIYLISILFFALYSQFAAAEERLQLDKTTILGNRELPKVTFVVPWRDVTANIPDLQLTPKTRPVAMPMDSELYHRQVEYLKQLENLEAGDKPK